MAERTGRAHGVGTGENAHEWADALARIVDDAGQELVYRPESEPHPATRRLMDSLGVRIEVGPVRTVVKCGAPLCAAEAKFGGFCRSHAPIGALRPENGHGAAESGRAALEAMDAGERQTPAARTGRPPKWTVEQAVQAIKDFHAKHGYVPVQRDASTNPELPSAGTVTKTLKVPWAELVERAGFPRPSRGGVGRGSVRAKAPEGQSDAPPAVRDEAAQTAEAVSEGASSSGVGIADEGARTEHLPVLPPADEPSDEGEKREVALSEPEPDEGGPLQGERVADAYHSGSLSAFDIALALTGDFEANAQLVRDHAALLRRQAFALDVIAAGLDQLEAA